MFRWTVVGGLMLAALFATRAEANTGPGHHHITRTYFGPPAQGPYGPYMRGPQVRTALLFGHCRLCVTPQDRAERLMRERQAIEARYHNDMARLNWRHQYAYLDPGHVGDDGCNCGGPGGSCGAGCGLKHKLGLFHKCKACGGGGCDACGGGQGHQGHFGKHHGGHGHHGGYGGAVPAPRGGPYYPDMNREDALRYIEGFQYYPPQHLLRSPRDHFMFDVKYGIGQ